jgi:hypothetical protein
MSGSQRRMSRSRRVGTTTRHARRCRGPRTAESAATVAATATIRLASRERAERARPALRAALRSSASGSLRDRACSQVSIDGGARSSMDGSFQAKGLSGEETLGHPAVACAGVQRNASVRRLGPSPARVTSCFAGTPLMPQGRSPRLIRRLLVVQRVARGSLRTRPFRCRSTPGMSARRQGGPPTAASTT